MTTRDKGITLPTSSILVSPLDATYGAKGDGVTDDTTALQACYTANPGRTIDHGSGKTYLVSAQLTCPSGVTLKGASKIQAKTNAAIAGALLYFSGATKASVQDLELDCNKSNNGANYGIWSQNGSEFYVNNTYIHDTIQAGIYLQGETDFIVTNNKVYNCGNNVGTNSHGIMAVSIDTNALQGGIISSNRVDSAYRKGITLYTQAAGGGAVKNITIQDNVVSNCGTLAASGGGIYAANQPGGATNITNINVTGNICFSNYINIEVDNTVNGVITGNTVGASSGSEGIACDSVTGIVITGNTITDSSVHGINLVNTSGGANKDITVSGNVISRSNTLSSGFGAGVRLNNTQNSTIVGNTVYDDAAKMTHGIAEQGTANSNVISSNNVNTATAAKYLILGASTVLDGWLQGSATYDPPNLAAGSGATTTVTVTGAALGDYAICDFSLDLQGITVTAYVSAANTVAVRFQNQTGGAIDLASGTLRARVMKAQ